MYSSRFAPPALCLAALTACTDYEAERLDVATAIAADADYDDERALVLLTDHCLKNKTSRATVVQQDGKAVVRSKVRAFFLTHATDLEGLKADLKRRLATNALCVFRASEGKRSLDRIELEQWYMLMEGGGQKTYVVSIERDQLEVLDDWQNLPWTDAGRHEIRDAVAPLFEVHHENFEGLEMSSVKLTP